MTIAAARRSRPTAAFAIGSSVFFGVAIAAYAAILASSWIQSVEARLSATPVQPAVVADKPIAKAVGDSPIPTPAVSVNEPPSRVYLHLDSADLFGNGRLVSGVPGFQAWYKFCAHDPRPDCLARMMK